MEHGIPPALDSFIIDGDVTARMRLKQAMGSVALFGRTDLAAGTREAVTRIAAAAYDYAVIFVSLGLNTDEVCHFIKEAKNLARSRDAAFVLVAASGAQDSSSLAACMVCGADGFLFEPYSVDQLVEITQLAAKVKGERAEKRERVAFSLLLKEVMQQLDMVAFRKSVHADLTRCWSKLAAACEPFRCLPEARRALFLEVAVEEFVKAPVPNRRLQHQNYQGVSERVRRRAEQMMLKQAEMEITGSYTATDGESSGEPREEP